MISNRHAPNAKENAELANSPASAGEGNQAWAARTGITDGILLLGGTSLSHFRIRVAQSHLRQDMLPSFWSFAGLYDAGKVQSVRLEFPGDASDLALVNGVQVNDIGEFDDPAWYPNVALITLGVAPRRIADNVERVKDQRSIIDLPRLILPWLGYVWGAGQRINPLLDGLRASECGVRRNRLRAGGCRTLTLRWPRQSGDCRDPADVEVRHPPAVDGFDERRTRKPEPVEQRLMR